MSDPYREHCRRRHRTIGAYLVIQAWLRGLDCIVLTRAHLERFLGLKRFKSERIRWLLSDVKPWFAHCKPYYKTGQPASIGSLFLSRVPIAAHLPKGAMSASDRIKSMAKGAPKAALFKAPTTKGALSEERMLAEMTLWGAGLREPT